MKNKELEFIHYLICETNNKISQFEMEKNEALIGLGSNDISDMIEDDCFRNQRDVVREAWNLAIDRGCNASTVDRVFTEEFEHYL